jgi:hypothetical protein
LEGAGAALYQSDIARWEASEIIGLAPQRLLFSSLEFRVLKKHRGN